MSSNLKKYPTAKNAERERSRVRSLRHGFQMLQHCLPSVPPDTKLSKLDILILATNYISVLMQTLDELNGITGDHTTTATMAQSLSSIRSHRYLKFYHPIKKWPMRSRLYTVVSNNHESTFE